MGARLRVAVCENFRRELEAVLAASPELPVVLSTFPATCERPAHDWPGLERALSKAPADQEVCFLGGSCLRRLGASPRPHWRVQGLEHCQTLLAGASLVQAALRDGAYVLTPGWLARWRQRLKQWGFDQEGARAFFGETTRELVLFDSLVLPDSEAALAEFAQYLGLPTRRVPVGLDHLSLLVGRLADQRLAAVRQAEVTARLAQAHRQSADLLMVFDVVSGLAGLSEEREAVQRVLDLFTTLCAPGVLAFLEVVDGVPLAARLRPSTALYDLDGLRRFASSTQESQRLGTAGFQIRLAHLGVTVGALLVDEVRFPEHRDHYLELALTVARVVALAISNARTFGRLEQTIGDLRAANEHVSQLRGLIPICSHCKKIRDDRGYWQAVENYILKAPDAQFSHGICNACLDEHYPEVAAEPKK